MQTTFRRESLAKAEGLSLGLRHVDQQHVHDLADGRSLKRWCAFAIKITKGCVRMVWVFTFCIVDVMESILSHTPQPDCDSLLCLKTCMTYLLKGPEIADASTAFAHQTQLMGMLTDTCHTVHWSFSRYPPCCARKTHGSPVHPNCAGTIQLFAAATALPTSSTPPSAIRSHSAPHWPS